MSVVLETGQRCQPHWLANDCKRWWVQVVARPTVKSHTGGFSQTSYYKKREAFFQELFKHQERFLTFHTKRRDKEKVTALFLPLLSCPRNTYMQFLLKTRERRNVFSFLRSVQPSPSCSRRQSAAYYHSIAGRPHLMFFILAGAGAGLQTDAGGKRGAWAQEEGEIREGPQRGREREREILSCGLEEAGWSRE